MRTRKKLRSARLVAGLGIALTVAVGICGCASPKANLPGNTTTTIGIDWVNFIQFQGITYLATYSRVGRGLQESDLGPVFATVRFELSGNITDPGYRSKDGDAAFLAPGTPIYMVKGYSARFRLAAHQDGQITLFEADTNTHAQKGGISLILLGRYNILGSTASRTALLNWEQLKTYSR